MICLLDRQIGPLFNGSVALALDWFAPTLDQDVDQSINRSNF